MTSEDDNMHLLIILGIIVVIFLIIMVIASFNDRSNSFWDMFWFFEAMDGLGDLLVALLEALSSGW